MEYKLYKGYILGPGEQRPPYDVYEVDIFLHKEDVASGSVWHTSESEWEAQLWLDGRPGDGTATQADVDELNKKDVEHAYPTYIMEKVRQRLGLEIHDTSRDDEINSMSHDVVFSHCLAWEGIIGFDYMITDLVKDIYKVSLD